MRDAVASSVPVSKRNTESYARILKSTSIIGGASVVNILIGIARIKVVALLLGPAGIGLIGLLNTLMSAAGTIVQMGIGPVATRQIAESHATGNGAKLAVARRALSIATIVLSTVGAGGVWLLREPLATHLLRNPELSGAVGWAGLGVGLSVAALAQTALIQGMRRIGDLGILQIGGALATTTIGLPLLWLFGEAMIPLYVVLVPLTSFLLGHLIVARLPKVAATPVALPLLGAHWRMFLMLGLPMMGAGIARTLTALWIQTDIKAQLGVEALGWYVASNTIAMQYVGLVLGAMAADYYPRLTGVIGDAAAARTLANQQTEVALLLAGPLILAMFPLAPWVIQLLYSDAFGPAAEVLRWQMAGTLLKVVSWPLGVILLAAGAGRSFFFTEVTVQLFMAAAATLLVDRMGLVGAGVAYLLAYVAYLPMIFWLAAREIGFRWSRSAMIGFVFLGAACAAQAVVIALAPAVGVPAGLALTFAAVGLALYRLHALGMTKAVMRKLTGG